MIVLHKLNHDRDTLYLNPDLIQIVEARPDTHIVLTTGTQLVVFESPEEVAKAVLAHKVRVVGEALQPPTIVGNHGEQA